MKSRSIRTPIFLDGFEPRESIFSWSRPRCKHAYTIPVTNYYYYGALKTFRLQHAREHYVNYIIVIIIYQPGALLSISKRALFGFNIELSGPVPVCNYSERKNRESHKSSRARADYANSGFGLGDSSVRMHAYSDVRRFTSFELKS